MGGWDSLALGDGWISRERSFAALSSVLPPWVRSVSRG